MAPGREDERGFANDAISFAPACASLIAGPSTTDPALALEKDRFGDVLMAAQRGEEWAASTLFDSVQPSLIRYLRWQEPSAADDLAGETWLAVAGRLGSFEGDEASFRAWVFAIARRRLADVRRRGARRRTVPTDPESLSAIAGGPDPADLVVGSISAQQAIEQLTARLSPEQAEIVILRVVAGFTVEEVAHLVGKQAGAVRVAQHRALRRLSRAEQGVPSVPGQV